MTWYVVAQNWSSRSVHAVNGVRPSVFPDVYLTRDSAESRLRTIKRYKHWRNADLFIMEVNPVE